MSAIGFYMGYCRPNDSLLDAWSDYLRDDTLSSLTAQKTGKYIKRASEKQLEAIGEATRIISGGLNTIIEMQGVLNRRMDLAIEQQKLTNIKLDTITELLKIPDSEKERQNAITLGIKFFVNAAKDEDLYQDALDNFLKAEQLQTQDYFVQHRIGCIYLYVPKLLDVEKATRYFDKAAKYAVVESDPDAIRIANLLTNQMNAEYTKSTSDTDSIRLLAADSYNKAALAYYILGDDDEAINQQKKAVQLKPSAINKFTYAKYLCRKGDDVPQAIEMLSEAVELDADIVNAIALESDLMDNSETLEWLKYKRQEADNILDEVLHEKENGSFKNSLFLKGRYTEGMSMKLKLIK